MKVISFFKERKTLVIVLLLLCIALLVCGYARQIAELSHFKEQVSQLEFNSQKFEETIGANGEKIIEQRQLILSQKDAIALKVLEIDKLKKVKSQVIVNTITKIDSIFIPFASGDTTDTLGVSSFIRVPQLFSLNNEWYGIKGNITKLGVNLDSLSFSNRMKITIGSKSVGIFKKPVPIVLLENENPYVITKGLQNIVVENNLKWYEKKSFWFGSGVGVGLITFVLIAK